MSHQVLYAALGVRGYEHRSIRLGEGSVIVRLRVTEEAVCCPGCGTREVVRRGPLATADYLKEDLRQLWSQTTKEAARRFLDGWVCRAESSEIRVLQQMARTLQTHRRGLLAWYDFRISTGPLEGLNNKIRTLQRTAYGYRDQDYFRLKLFALHTTHYVLIG